MAEHGKHEFDKKVEEHLAKVCIDEEFFTAKSNSEAEHRQFEEALGLIELGDTGEEYDWHSDVHLPEYLSIYLTQASTDAATYFQTRDYVETYLQEGSPESRAKADAAKECINRTLNQKHLFWFQKYMRSQAIRRLYKQVVWRCWWEREDYEAVTGFRPDLVDEDFDVYGEPITNPDIQIPAKKEVQVPITEMKPKVDRFNCDVTDPRNVFTSDEYTYTLQEKRYVYIRSEKTLDQFRDEEAQYGFFNLDRLEEVVPPLETETSKESYNKDVNASKVPQAKGKPYDYIEGYKKDWVIVTERDPETLEPMKAEPGIDDMGKVKKGAELQEVIVGFAISGSQKTLVRWHLTPYVDTMGNPFRPLVRGLCYIHPTKDGGLGDGMIAAPLQSSINDTFNVSNDRVLLSTLPTLIANKYAVEDNDTIRIAPDHVIEVFNPKEDIQEFKVSDDVIGALNQIGMLKNTLQQALAVYPTTMGNVGDIKASTTATAIAGTESRTDARSHYTSLTAEFTMLVELYWMILQMTGKYAHPDTGIKLMGEKVYDFSPNEDYMYKPLTQAIETASSKQAKNKELVSVLGYVVQLQNPKLINMLLARILKNQGDEMEDFEKALFDESRPVRPVEGAAEGDQGSPPPALATSNQNAVPMSAVEGQAREGTYAF